MKIRISQMIIKPEITVINALKKLSKTGERCLIVVNDNKKFLGTITDGDIRKSILKKESYSSSIKKIYNRKAAYILKSKFNQNIAERVLRKKKHILLPILDKKMKPVDFFTIYDSKRKEIKLNKNIILIMAGGKGKRLQPFTSILPKPLIPVKGKPVILHIMNMFKSGGFNKFYISINNKNNVLKSYLSEMSKMYNLSFLKENNPLGSAGALKKIIKIKETFFVVNCDGLLKLSPNQLLNFHKENKNDLTLVAALKKFSVPYGVCEVNKLNGKLNKMEEKPQKNVIANAGLYICEPKIFKYLPAKKSFGMNELIKNLLRKKRKVGVFPIKDTDWQDTGNWLDYMSVIKES